MTQRSISELMLDPAALSGGTHGGGGPHLSVSPIVANRQTRATQLLGRLRAAVISGQLAPGDRLVVGTLAETFEAGHTPVREALMRLASEGYVVQEDQRGFSVAPISRTELVQLTEARVVIEALVIRMAIQHGNDDWEGAVLAATHRLLKMNKLGPDGQTIDPIWNERHLAFHQALVAACPNLVLLSTRSLLSDRAERYRHLSVRYLKAPRDDRAEHEAMSAAVLSRDTDRAERLVRNHIERTTEILLADIDGAS